MSTLANTNKTYLITGANRGIGRHLADIFLTRPNTTVVALVRDPCHTTSQSLLSLKVESAAEPSNQGTYGANSRPVLIQYDASDPSAADRAISQLRNDHRITSLDVVIANAGFSGYFGPTLQATTDDWLTHYTTNTLGPIMLFRACLPLLHASTSPLPTFVAISSAVGSTALVAAQTLALDTDGQPRRGALPYGASKCALNHIMVRLANENRGTIRMKLLTPGPTKTGFGGDSVDWEKVPGVMDVETVAKGLVDRIDEDDAEDEPLKLKDWSGKIFDW